MQGFTVLKAHNFILNVLTIEQPVDVMQLVVTSEYSHYIHCQ
jgi:hypothetical protein